MRKIQPAGWAAIVMIVLLVGYFGYKGFHKTGVGVTSTELVVSSSESTDSGISTASTVSTSVSTSQFASTLKSTPPINGSLMGIVEVGASGFVALGIEIDYDGNWTRKARFDDKSLAFEGLASEEAIASKMREFFVKLLDYGIPAKNLHFVMSSGAMMNPVGAKITAYLKKMNYVVNSVTAYDEGVCAALATIPKEHRSDSYSMDIGSGNTKITWYANGKWSSTELPGAKYYETGKDDNAVYTQVKEAAAKIPEANRKHCFIVGGIPYELAKKSGMKDERYTDLKSPSDYKDEGNAKLKSGLVIYRATAEGAGTETFTFDQFGTFSIGKLLQIKGYK